MKKILHRIQFTLVDTCHKRNSTFIFEFNGASMTLQQLEEHMILRCAECNWLLSPVYVSNLFNKVPVI